MVSSQPILRMFANMITTADMAATLETIFHLVIMTQMVLRKDLTAIALGLEIDSEHTIHGIEAEAAFEATHVAGSIAYAHRADSGLEIDVYDGTTNIYVQTCACEICHAKMWKLPSQIGRPQMHAFDGTNQKKPYESKLPSSISRSNGTTSYE